MKCSNCEYLYYPEYESNYTSCRVFGDETPDRYSRKDGEGCTCNRKQLAKMFHENEEAWMKEANPLLIGIRQKVRRVRNDNSRID